MAASLDQIIQQLQGSYQPQIDLVQKQQADLPGQQQAAEQGLNAQKDQGFTDILSAARSRGTGVAFGGIPLQEQSKYLATNYLPAVANLKSSYNQQATSLQDAINQIYEKRNTQALGIQQFQQQQEEATRQFNENLAFQRQQLASQERQAAAARAASSSAYSPSLGATASAAPKVQYIGKDDFRGHLAYLAANGDNNAKVALGIVGNDNKYYLDPYTTNPAVFKALDAIGAQNTWRPK